VQGDEIAESRRSREADSAQIDQKVRLATPVDVLFIRCAQLLNRGRVETKAIPEFSDQETANVVNLERGFQHQRTCAGE
jgi:hypothetical protein